MGDEQEEGNAELLALHRIDETCTRLQQQGNYLEALECMERGLVLRQHFFGPASDEVWAACKTVGEMCNLLAMTYLQQEDFPMVIELLKKAEILTERDEKGRAVTFNNLACYYRRQGKLHSALQYLQKALKLEQRLTDVTNRADTHLNLCAVLSQLGRHSGALEHAQSALILLQEELFPGPNGGKEAPQKKTAGVDRIAVLAIAYHNTGVELEFLKRFEAAIESYRKGVEISEAHLGEQHGITQTLRNSFIAARQSVQSRTKTRRPGAGARGQGRRPGGGKRRGQPQAKSPQAVQKDMERWENIQKAYGDVALGVKPKPTVSAEYNMHAEAAKANAVADAVAKAEELADALSNAGSDSDNHPATDDEAADDVHAQIKPVDKLDDAGAGETEVAERGTADEEEEEEEEAAKATARSEAKEAEAEAEANAEAEAEAEAEDEAEDEVQAEAELRKEEENAGSVPVPPIDKSVKDLAKTTDEDIEKLITPRDETALDVFERTSSSKSVAECSAEESSDTPGEAKAQEAPVEDDEPPSPEEKASDVAATAAEEKTEEEEEEEETAAEAEAEEETAADVKETGSVSAQATADEDLAEPSASERVPAAEEKEEKEEAEEAKHAEDDAASQGEKAEDEAKEEAGSEEKAEDDVAKAEPVLPAGWTKEFSRSKKKEYFFNAETGESVWSLDAVPTGESKADE